MKKTRIETLAAASPGALAAALAGALWLSPAPVRAGPASCAPTPNGQIGSSSRTDAAGTQVCSGGDTGVAYQATGGDLTVDLNNDPINGHAVNLSDDGGARNLTLNIGLPGAGYAAAPVLATDSSSNGVKIISSGGNVQFTSYAGGAIAFTGGTSPSYAVNLQTSGFGTITATAGDTLTNTTGAGLYAASVNGAVSITADANVTAAARALSAVASGTGNVSAALGDGVTLSNSVAGVYANSAQGTATATLGAQDSITTAASANSVGVYVQSNQTPAVGALTATLTTGANATVSTTGNNSAALQAVNLGNGLGGAAITVGDGAQLTTTGQGDVGVYAGTLLLATHTGSGAGDVSVQLGNNAVIAVNAGNGVGGQGGDVGVLAASQGGNVSVVWTGSGGSVAVHEAGGLPTQGVYATTTGAGSATIVTGVGTSVQSDNGDGVGANAQNGVVGINVQGAVTATGGDAIHAYATGAGSVSVVAGSALNPVSLTAVDPTNDAVYAADGGAGNISVATFGTAAGELYASALGAGSITVSANGTLTTAPGQAAIYASAQTGAVSVTTNATLSDTLLAQTTSGAITLSTQGAITAPGSDFSVAAFSNSGNISLTSNGALTGGVNLITGGAGTLTVNLSGGVTQTQPIDAVYASTSDGANAVTIASGPIVAAVGGYGVDAYAGGQGSVSVVVGDGVSVSTPSVALHAQSAGGAVSVRTGIGVTLTAADTVNAGGITARSDWAAPTAQTTASILTGANTAITVNGDTSTGVLAVNDGGGLGGALVQLGAGNSVTITGDTVAGVVAATSTGVYNFGAVVNGAGAAVVQIGAGDVVTIYGGNSQNVLAPVNGGVVASSAGGDVTVQWTGAGGAVTVNGGPGVSTVGVLASNIAGGTGAGSVTVVTGVGTAIASSNGIGILAANANTGAVSVTSNGAIQADAGGSGYFGSLGGLLRSGEYAAGILASGAGNVAVVSNAAIAVRGGDGVDASGQGAVSVTNAGPIAADQTALSALAGTGPLTIVNSSVMQGLGSVGLPVVSVGAAQGVSLTNSAGGLIGSNAMGPSDLVLSAALAPTGAVVLNNLGTLVGRLDLSNASSAAVSNGGVWLTGGASLFPAGGTLANSGTIEVVGAATFAKLGTLTNSGTIDLHAASGGAGDSLTVAGAFVGGAGSRVVLDAVLGVTGSGATCGALADCLSVGASSGSTRLVIHNVAALSAAGPNPAGILVVNGASSGADFTLDPASSNYDSRNGLLDDGLFSYALGYDAAAHQERLYGLPNGAAFRVPVLLTGAESLWYDVAPWTDRQTEFRDRSGGAERGRDGTQVWLQVVGEESQRGASASYTLAQTGDTYRFDTSYNQRTGGLVGGVDLGIQPHLTAGDHLLVGVSAGILSSQLDFSAAQSRADYEGAVVGAYGSYLVDGFFVDLSLDADLMKLKLNDQTAGVAAKPNLNDWGGRVELGRRWGLSRRWYWEPLATVAAVSTRIDTATLGPAVADFGAGQASARGGLGARLGAEPAAAGGLLTSWSLTARVWDSFSADNRVVLSAGGAAAPVTDRFDGAIGDLSGRFSFWSANGAWSASFGAGVAFKDGYTREDVTAALRYRW
jgi:hypothetical protein